MKTKLKLNMKPGSRLMGVIVVVLLSMASAFVLAMKLQPPQKPIKIGVIHALTGSMANSEKPLVDMVRMAVEDINAKGGLLGRPVEILVRDSQSDPSVAAKMATGLIIKDHVAALFGCWTSACRKAVKPVVEAHQQILFYPLQYEGVEQSPNIVYTGAAPNQQIIPAGVWAVRELGKRVFLVGSDYVFPRMANIILNDVVRINGGRVVGEMYLKLGSRDTAPIIAALQASGADVILNTINGDTNASFFKDLAALGDQAPAVVSFSVSEPELARMPAARVIEHYGAWNYFQSLPGPENKRFIARVQAYYRGPVPIGAPMESTVTSVHLWARAVRSAGSTATAQILQAITRQSMNRPDGIVSVDPATLHLWKTARIGRVMPDGQFEQVWSSSSPLRPQPFPAYRSHQNWLDLLHTLEVTP